MVHVGGEEAHPPGDDAQVRHERIAELVQRAARARMRLLERSGESEVPLDLLEQLELSAADTRRAGSGGRTAGRPLGSKPCDLFITHNEVCRAHGTGILATRLMEQSDTAVLVRSDTLYGGACDVKVAEEFVLGRHTTDRKAIYRAVADWLAPYSVQLILSIPFHEQELETALAAQAITSAKHVIYLMDDNCLTSSTISHALMAKALDRAELRLAISPQMRDAYEEAFGLPFEVVPPVVSSRFISTNRAKADPKPRKDQTGVVIGNVWSSIWFDKIRETIRGSGRTLHWYFGAERPHWMSIAPEKLVDDGIVFHAETPQEEVNAAVAAAAFIVIPYGTLEESGHELGIAKLSLPSRMPFVAATSGTPMLVLGHPQSGAGRFVLDFGLGEVSPYESAAFLAAINRLCQPERQAEIRRNAAELAPRLTSAGLLDFVRRSAEQSQAADDRFTTIFPRATDLPRARSGLRVGLGDLLRSAREDGLTPSRIVDTGLPWGADLRKAYPDAPLSVFDPGGWTAEELRRECLRWLDETAANIQDPNALLGVDLSNDPSLTLRQHEEALTHCAAAAVVRSPWVPGEDEWGVTETVVAMQRLGFALRDQAEANSTSGRRFVDQLYFRTGG